LLFVVVFAQGSTGQASCALCPAGYFQADAGSAFGPASLGCSACPEGFFSSGNGSVSCGQCAAATYSNDARTGCVDACQNGFVAVNPRNTRAQQASRTILAATPYVYLCFFFCAVGGLLFVRCPFALSSKVSASGGTVCTACPASTYQSSTASGKGECIRCPTG
jgi:hypothetical protein